MILSDVIDARVRDASGAALGYVIDVRFVLDGPADRHLARPRLHGLLVGPRRTGSFMGYERRDATAPWLIAHVLRWRHRGTFLVLWADVLRVGTGGVTLREGHRAVDPRLGSARSSGP